MDSLTTLCIFIIILFLYIHIANQFKISEETEIYESDFKNNNHLNEICELKQPLLMNMEYVCPSLFSDIQPETIARYSSHDIGLKDCNDYFSPNLEENQCYDPIILPLHTTIKYLETDKSSHLFSENNQDFLDETGLIKKIQKIDEYIKPHFCIHSKYDLLFGSCNTVTPLKYQNDNRTFLCLTSGKVRIKMTPWKSTKYLQLKKDYEQYEFRSHIHPTKPHADDQYDFEKIDFIEFDMNPGYMLYIPPYWYYSIIYLDEPSTFICKISYNTIMSTIANIKDIGLYFLQQQNISKNVGSKKIKESDVKQFNENEQQHKPEQEPEQEVNISEIKPDSHTMKDNNTSNLETPTIETSNVLPNNTSFVSPVKQTENENITYNVSNI